MRFALEMSTIANIRNIVTRSETGIIQEVRAYDSATGFHERVMVFEACFKLIRGRLAQLLENVPVVVDSLQSITTDMWL